MVSRTTFHLPKSLTDAIYLPHLNLYVILLLLQLKPSSTHFKQIEVFAFSSSVQLVNRNLLGSVKKKI